MSEVQEGAENSAGLRIWHVGNWCIHIGQKYVESPFEAPSKDVEVLNYAQPFVDALRAIPGAEVISQPSWELYHMSPEASDRARVGHGNLRRRRDQMPDAPPRLLPAREVGLRAARLPRPFRPAARVCDRRRPLSHERRVAQLRRELGKGAGGPLALSRPLPSRMPPARRPRRVDRRIRRSLTLPEHPAARGIDWRPPRRSSGSTSAA